MSPDDGAPDPSILPVGYLGMVAPMNSLGFAPNPGLGIVYEEAIVLLPAQLLIFSFQRKRAADESTALPYDEAVSREGVRVFRLYDLESAELVRPITGHRLVLRFRDGEQRWILQQGDVDEVRRTFSELLGDRFTDDS